MLGPDVAETLTIVSKQPKVGSISLYIHIYIYIHVNVYHIFCHVCIHICLCMSTEQRNTYDVERKSRSRRNQTHNHDGSNNKKL